MTSKMFIVRSSRRLIACCCLAMILSPAVLGSVVSSVPAFPGAEGFGSDTPGGRGGQVMLVTNLNDSGSGSFRACAEATVPRICVFRVSGIITVQNSVDIESPYITIAGQTAPGDGIILRNDPSHAKSTLRIQTHNVVVRYLRIRAGASTNKSSTHRALSMYDQEGDVYNIVIDHCSLSWASDEVVNSWYAARQITFQWNIVTDSFNCANHEENDKDDDGVCDHFHSKGPLFGSAGSHSFSVHHNLLAHHTERNPRMTTEGVADIVNNVVYNPMFSASQVDNGQNSNGVKSKANYVSNYMRAGVDSGSDYLISLYDRTGDGHAMYLQGNICPSRESQSDPEKDVCKQRDSASSWQVTNRHPAPAVTTYTCDSPSQCEVYDRVVAQAGARIPTLDAVDRRVLAEVETGTGQIIDAPSSNTCYFVCRSDKVLSPSDYTIHGITDPLSSDGFPILSSSATYPDADGDGMDDNWEIQRGLNPNINDASEYDLDSDYTNIEVFLNSLVGGGGGGTPSSPAPTPAPAPGSSQISVRVDQTNDDAEEYKTNGNMYLDSSDLEMVTEGSDEVLVGLRFRDITIPKDASITSAYIEFVTDETDSFSTSLTIRGETSNDAASFSSANSDISDRPLTTDAVDWNNIPAWNQVDETHQTPDLSAIVQDIVSRSGWSSGNAMAFVISGSGKRVAKSFDKGSGQEAPLLVVEYTTGQPPLTGACCAESGSCSVTEPSACSGSFQGSGTNCSPGICPTPAPTPGPTSSPTLAPTRFPTSEPTQGPTREPTPAPTPVPTPVSGPGTTQVVVRVDQSNDDAEEYQLSGEMYLDSSDLEMVAEGSDELLVGLRFRDITIPKDASITSAYIEFVTDETDSVSTLLTISGEASNDAASFSLANSDISDRPLTSDTIDWNNIPAWNQVNETHQTPDLSAIVQEVVSGLGWSSGNAMAFVISGSGKRVAKSFDKGSGQEAPLLVVEYTTGQPPVTGACCDLSGSCSVTEPSACGGSFLGSGTSCSPGSCPTPTEIAVRVDQTNDDAEEYENGSMYLDSSDLEMVADGTDDLMVGLRFRDIAVPQGATITSAYIEFVTDETDSVFTSLTFRGEASNDASTFSSSYSDISDRTLTTDVVNWTDIPAWNQVDEIHQTPDLSAIVQEVVNRSGWSSGNAMAFVISGSGKRVAKSFDKGSGQEAPLLVVEYTAN